MAAFALLLAAPSLKAQIKGGIFIDQGSSYFRYAGVAEKANKGTKGRYSYGVGARIEAGLSDMFTFTGGIGYKTYGANGENYKLEEFNNIETTTADKFQYKLGYLTIPIGVKAKITDLSDGLSLNASLGIQPMILMGGKVAYTGDNISTGTNTVTTNAYGWDGMKSTKWAQPFDFGINFGVGTDFYLDGVGTIQGQLLFNMNFIKVEQKNMKDIQAKFLNTSTNQTSTTTYNYEMGDGTGTTSRNFLNNNDKNPQNANMFMGIQIGFLLGSNE